MKVEMDPIEQDIPLEVGRQSLCDHNVLMQCQLGEAWVNR